MSARMESADLPSPSKFGSKDNSSQDQSANDPATTALHQSKDKLVLDLKTVVNDAQALLKEVADASAESIQDRLAVVKGKLQEVKGSLENKAKQVVASGETYVKENPWRAVGIVCVASVVLSLVMVRAFSSAIKRS